MFQTCSITSCTFAVWVACLIAQAYGQRVETTWSGVDGNWSDASLWSNGLPQNQDVGIEYVAEIAAGELAFDISTVISDLVVRGGRINLLREFDPETSTQIHKTLTVLGDAHWLDGQLVGNGRLNVHGNFTLEGGSIRAAGGIDANRLIKSGWSLGQFRQSVFDGEIPIEVRQGVLELLDVERLQNKVEVTSSEFAVVSPGRRTNNDFILNSATGFRNAGPLHTNDFTEIGGDIYLGADGARLSLDMVLRGNIHGGERTINDYLAHQGSSSDHSGPINIAIDGRYGELDLTRGGIASPNTTQINVGAEGRLRFGNQFETIENRLADDVPIHLHGGRLTIVGVDNDPNGAITEKIGEVTLHKGSSLLESVGFHTLEIAELVRQEDSTIQFGVARGGSRYSVNVEEPLELENEIIGPWAVSIPADFVTYVDGQVVRLGDRVPRPEDINAALPTDHFRLRSFVEQMQEDRSIYSLASDVSGGTFLNLRGFTLNIVSGGLVAGDEGLESHVSRIINGTLTVGSPGEPGELYVHSVNPPNRFDQRQLAIETDIIDNNGGPLQLIKSGPGNTWLRGENKYTGGTLVNHGHLIVEKDHSLPDAGMLDINGGRMRLAFDSPKQLDTIRIAQNGGLGSESNHEPSVSFSSLELESGTVGVELFGNGTIEKRTAGTATISTTNPNFHGNVTIHDGILVAGSDGGVAVAEKALGTGTVTVREGGTLVHGSIGNQERPMSLLHANIELQGGDVGIAIGSSGVAWEWRFIGPWAVSQNSRLLAIDPASFYAGDNHADALVHIVDPVEILNDSQLEVIGPKSVHFGSPVTLRPNARLLSTSNLVLNSPLHLSEGAAFQSNTFVDGSIVVENGGILRVDDGNSTIARIAGLQQMEWGPGGKLLDWNVEKQPGIAVASDSLSTKALKFASSAETPGILQLTGTLQVNETERLRERQWLIIEADTVEGIPAIDIDVSLLTTDYIPDAQFSTSLVEGVGLFVAVEFRSDHNDNGLLDTDDIDIMCSSIGQSGNLVTDLDGDGSTTLLDFERLITHNIGTEQGDTNLDFKVDFADFLKLSAGFGTSGGWAHGDSNCSGTTDFADFLALSRNFQSVQQQATVPEPSSLPCLLVLSICSLARRERRA